MRKGLHIILVLDVLCNIKCIFTGAAARAVGDADKGGTQLGDFLGCLFDAVERGVLLRREDLEGERKCILFQCMHEFHSL